MISVSQKASPSRIEFVYDGIEVEELNILKKFETLSISVKDQNDSYLGDGGWGKSATNIQIRDWSAGDSSLTFCVYDPITWNFLEEGAKYQFTLTTLTDRFAIVDWPPLALPSAINTADVPAEIVVDSGVEALEVPIGHRSLDPEEVQDGNGDGETAPELFRELRIEQKPPDEKEKNTRLDVRCLMLCACFLLFGVALGVLFCDYFLDRSSGTDDLAEVVEEREEPSIEPIFESLPLISYLETIKTEEESQWLNPTNTNVARELINKARKSAINGDMDSVFMSLGQAMVGLNVGKLFTQMAHEFKKQGKTSEYVRLLETAAVFHDPSSLEELADIIEAGELVKTDSQSAVKIRMIKQKDAPFIEWMRDDF